MIRILMVCLGNICRSPLAHGILDSKLDTEAFKVDSAGTSNYHIGSLPDKRSVAVAKKNNLDISNQHGRQFIVEDFETYDYIYVMDKSNFENVIKMARNVEDIAKVKLILNESHPSKNLEVPDPYYGGDSGFDDVFNMLDKACNVIAKKLKQ
ncbi:low molecular weight protein-tyrosine-phosphatase [Lacinutrix sp. Bg11-31]|uniref:low molecular weight protein-tyrosine-phosphatase n=1 Tax=Lacinutrix sp. Bg11-31 TaxID=2057808 RepID=UPI000C30284A|nr:low molecular weight protein-tyrosine-phosphatase [Lacinutrix sp. Bg11-31]AUC81934.1 protein-tyrosine-phosphatase [Lacinutrix sp. Bg11-31]